MVSEIALSLVIWGGLKRGLESGIEKNSKLILCQIIGAQPVIFINCKFIDELTPTNINSDTVILSSQVTLQNSDKFLPCLALIED